MASSQPTLFGAYPWAVGSGVAPVLFGEGFAPETFMLSLSESITDTDADLFSTVKVLSDSLTISEADTKVLSRRLADSTTQADAIAKTLEKIFMDSGSVADNKLVFTVKTLSDFLILKEWISVRLTKSLIWTNPSANENLHDFLFGRYLFGTQLFGGVKPSSSWTRLGQRNPSVWTNTDGSKYNY